MKINGRDYVVTPIKAGTATPAGVVLRVSMHGMLVASETITPDEARALAAQLQLAANLAEGKTA